MKKISKAISFVLLLCMASVMLISCNNNNEIDAWHSPMLAASIETKNIDIYQDFDLSALNINATSPSQLSQNSGITTALISLAYRGESQYKARIGIRVDKVEVEEDGSIGHSVAEFGVKSHVSVLFYAQGTWFEGAYGANAASGGDTLFDDRYYAQTDAHYSTTRRAILLNKETAQDFSSIEFYVVGRIDGHYVLNFFIEQADSHGHFHGLCKLALSSVIITVGSPQFETNEVEATEHDHD